MRAYIHPLILLLFLLSFPHTSYGEGPQEQLKLTIDDILYILRDGELNKPVNGEKRRQKIRRAVDRRLDYEEISRRSLALHWKERSPEEKREFVSLFQSFLERIYMKGIEKYDDEEIAYDDVTIDNGYALVKIKIISKNGVQTRLDFRLHQKSVQWEVYDVVVEGVSLVKNYRNQFNRVIRSSSYDELVRRLGEKKSRS